MWKQGPGVCQSDCCLASATTPCAGFSVVTATLRLKRSQITHLNESPPHSMFE